MPRPFRALGLAALLGFAPAAAQTPPPAPGAPPAVPATRPPTGAPSAGAATTPADVRALIERMRRKLDDLGRTTSARDSALGALDRQVERAAGELSGGRETNDALRQRTRDLSATVDALDRGRTDLDARLGAAVARGERDAGALRGRLTDLGARLDAERKGAADLRVLVERTRTEGAERDAARAAELARAYAAVTALGAERERLGAEIDQLRAATREGDAARERLRAAFLDRLAAGADGRADGFTLGRRLVLPADLLFRPGTATLDDAGRERLDRLAAALLGAARDAPAGLDWLLRIDGHADAEGTAPGVTGSAFALSGGQALAVAERLVRGGVPPERLAVMGMGDLRPVDARGDEIAARRNRRMELTLGRP